MYELALTENGDFEMRKKNWGAIILVTALFAALAVPSFVAGQGGYGCYICETDYDSCLLLTGPCDKRCKNVYNGEGDGILCNETYFWGGILCEPSGGACSSVTVCGDCPPEGPEGGP